jgi:chromate reductase
MANPVTILGIAGSLRRDSYNRAILRSVRDLTPTDAQLEIFEELGQIPLFNQDEEANPPEVISTFKSKIRQADAILFVTPEYNYSIPGVLKNAIDWASRPYGDSAWAGKPAAIISASPSLFGAARAQYHLRQVFVFLDMYAINRPEVMIGKAPERFDNQGRLVDHTTQDLIRLLLQNLIDWTRQLNASRSVGVR